MSTDQVLRDQVDGAVTAWVRLLRAHAAVSRAFSAQLQEGHGLTITDFEVLLRLSHAPDGRMRRVDLAEGVMLTPSGITRLLDGLQGAGLVEKAGCPTDARVTYAALTPAGRTVLAAAAADHHAAVDAMFAERFSPEELRSLGELLGRLPGALEGDESRCRPPE